MSIFKRIGISVFFFWSVSGSLMARADGFVLGVTNPRCQVSQFSKEKNRFVKTTRKLSLFTKFKIAGKHLPQSDAITVFMVEGNESGQLFAVPTSCVRFKEAYHPPKAAVVDIGPPPPPPRAFANRLRPGETGLEEIKGSYMTLAFMSWQEQIAIKRSANDPGGALNVPALVTTMAVCPGFGFFLVKNPRFQMAWDTCAFFGISNLGNKEQDPETSYVARNVQGYGVITGPSFLFSHSQTLAAGLEIPVAVRRGQWPNPPVANWTADNKLSVYPLYLFTTHWRGEHWGFVQKIGLLKTWPGYFWSLQVNRNF